MVGPSSILFKVLGALAPGLTPTLTADFVKNVLRKTGENTSEANGQNSIRGESAACQFLVTADLEIAERMLEWKIRTSEPMLICDWSTSHVSAVGLGASRGVRFDDRSVSGHDPQ